MFQSYLLIPVSIYLGNSEFQKEFEIKIDDVVVVKVKNILIGQKWHYFLETSFKKRKKYVCVCVCVCVCNAGAAHGPNVIIVKIKVKLTQTRTRFQLHFCPKIISSPQNVGQVVLSHPKNTEKVTSKTNPEKNVVGRYSFEKSEEQGEASKREVSQQDQ